MVLCPPRCPGNPLAERGPMATEESDHQTEYIDLKGLKQILPLGTRTVWRHVAEGKLPKPFKIGGAGKALWSRAEVEACIERAKRDSQ